jgi:hypothetical protein
LDSLKNYRAVVGREEAGELQPVRPKLILDMIFVL